MGGAGLGATVCADRTAGHHRAVANITHRLREPSTFDARLLQAIYDGTSTNVDGVYARALHDRRDPGREALRLAVEDALGSAVFAVVDALAADDDMRSLRTVGDLTGAARALFERSS